MLFNPPRYFHFFKKNLKCVLGSQIKPEVKAQSPTTISWSGEQQPGRRCLQTCEGPGLVGGHGAQVAQVALVPHQHDDDVVVRVVSELL